MANIIAYIRKEAEKGNTLINTKGDFVSPEKLENSMRKSYLQGLKNGSVSFDKSFAEYQQSEIEKSFLTVSAFEKVLLTTGFFEAEEPTVCMPDPQETVAQ